MGWVFPIKFLLRRLGQLKGFKLGKGRSPFIAACGPTWWWGVDIWVKAKEKRQVGTEEVEVERITSSN